MNAPTPLEIRILANMTDEQLCRAADQTWNRWVETQDPLDARTSLVFHDEVVRRYFGLRLFIDQRP